MFEAVRVGLAAGAGVAGAGAEVVVAAAGGGVLEAAVAAALGALDVCWGERGEGVNAAAGWAG